MYLSPKMFSTPVHIVTAINSDKIIVAEYKLLPGHYPAEDVRKGHIFV